jgi:hypothetical protein
MFTLLLMSVWIFFSGMVGGGALGEVIGTAHVTTIMGGVTIGVVSRVFTVVYIQGGEDITRVVIGTVARGTIGGFLINNLYVGITGITGVN